MTSDLRKKRAANQDIKVPCFVCPVQEPLPTAEDHHRVPRAFGGTDDQSNRVWLCSSCHTRLHRVQEFLIRGSVGDAYGLVQSIFPSNGKARESLWTLANEAANAQRMAEEVFGAHKTEQRITLTIDMDAWNAIKAIAKERKISATRYAADVLTKHVQATL